LAWKWYYGFVDANGSLSDAREALRDERDNANRYGLDYQFRLVRLTGEVIDE